MLYRWRNKSWRYRGIAAGLKAGKSMDELIEEFKVSGHTILTIAEAERLAAQKETKKEGEQSRDGSATLGTKQTE